MGNDRRSKEASDTGQWERMQTGRVSEHFWAKSDYVRRVAATNVLSTTLKTESILGNHKTFFNDNQSKSSVQLCYPSLRRMQKKMLSP